MRVLSADGQPINGLQAVMRNILRFADMMPALPLSALTGEAIPMAVPTCIVGLVTPMLSPRFQRLGDLVCGTIVVIEDRSWLFGVAKVDDPRAAQLAEYIPANFEIRRQLSRAVATYVERRRFFSTARRREIARHLAEPLLKRFHLPGDTSYDLMICALYHRAFIADQGRLGARHHGRAIGQAQQAAVAVPSGIRSRESGRFTQAAASELAGARAALQPAGESSRKRTLERRAIARFAALYRSVCADLALADAYQLPPNTVQYLHRLVGRAHNQLYRSRRFDLRAWSHTLLVEVPQRIFCDRCVQTAFCFFWGVFIASAYLAQQEARWPHYAEQMLTENVLDQMKESFADPIQGRNAAVNPVMASFYIQHNTSIGLQCFAGGLLVVPGLLVTVFNAAHLGAAFGYMARPDVSEGANFFHFVTAHGPFELTAIVLSAGAGLRLGMSWIRTDGRTPSRLPPPHGSRGDAADGRGDGSLLPGSVD